MKNKIHRLFKNDFFRKKVLPNLVVFVIMASVMLVLKLIFHPCVVSGYSMSPTLRARNIIKTDTHFSASDIKNGDIILFWAENRDKYIKRVIGIPGDTVSIKDGVYYINGIREYYGYFDLMENAGILAESSITLGDNEYFCSGDNRNGSYDSRDFGVVKYEKIIGIYTGILF